MIKDSIIKVLHEHWPNYDIYGDIVKQGFKEPCFFVKQITKYAHNEVATKDYSESYDIHFFLDQEKEDKDIEYSRIGDTLLWLLELLPIKDNKLIRGKGRSYEIVDDVMHFYITYDYGTYKFMYSETMETLNIEESVKDE